MNRWLTRTVFILSAVSLLNDMAGELLYPVLPLYMSSIGYGALWIGILEGFAEAVSGLTRGWFGEWSDRRGMRLPFIRWGYLLSAICKPLLAVFAAVPWAILMRTGDRLGKGVRTGARDAMLADESASETRGKVFGFHRSMDTVGAVLGPLLALIWLAYNPGAPYKLLFFYAFIPGLLSVALLFFIKEKRKAATGGIPRSPFSSFVYWKKASPDYRKLLKGILFFTFFNSSDMFILLLVKKVFEHGVDIASYHFSADMLVVSMYIFYNLFYALFAYPAGAIGDKLGFRSMMRLGYLFFALAYGGMALLATGLLSGEIILLLCFVLYGLYAACTDGISKAWVSRLCKSEEKGIALGLFASLSSMATLAASLIAGLIWSVAGPAPVFILPALAGLIALIYLTFAIHKPVQAGK